MKKLRIIISSDVEMEIPDDLTEEEIKETAIDTFINISISDLNLYLQGYDVTEVQE